MKLIGVCLETHNVQKLIQFYETVLKEKAEGDSQHSEFKNAQLAIYNPDYPLEDREKKEERLKEFVLMFHSENVDRAYTDLKEQGFNFISPPEVKPWGVKTLILKDPDGNRVHLLTPLKDLQSV